MSTSYAGTECWGQPPISACRMYIDGDSFYATELHDYYGELAAAANEDEIAVLLTREDLEDIESFDKSVNEHTIAWEDLKQELAKDGLL